MILHVIFLFDLPCFTEPETEEGYDQEKFLASDLFSVWLFHAVIHRA